MTVLLHFVLGLHVLGLAAIIGPWLAAPRSGRVNLAMVWGARLQLVTGLLLVGLVYATDGTPNNTKLAVKLLVALGCVACLEMANARQRRAGGSEGVAVAGASGGAGTAAAGTAVGTAPVAATLVNAGVALAILNVFVAVLWK